MLAQRGKTDLSEISRGGSLVGTAKLAVGVERSRYPRPSSRGRLPVPSMTHSSNVLLQRFAPRVETARSLPPDQGGSVRLMLSPRAIYASTPWCRQP